MRSICPEDVKNTLHSHNREVRKPTDGVWFELVNRNTTQWRRPGILRMQEHGWSMEVGRRRGAMTCVGSMTKLMLLA